MGKIRVMSAKLANQIAAGEVVERPASCVKELIENSLDAGAANIWVTLEDGGISRIVVQDDGCGMDAEDARLAFARHASSKVCHPRDLLRISTLGFRGEALASIAAVARVRLQTRPREAVEGFEVVVEGSPDPGECSPIGMPPGTRIEVRDLFFNTPARLKYLRTVATEQARCVEVVQKAALGHPGVAFRIDVDGHTVFRSGGRGDALDVLAALYGVSEARQLIRVAVETADYRVHGWVGRPNQAKASRTHGHWFVNQRPIRNHALHQAVVAGYGHRLMVNRHPIYALYVDLDPALVDVNIHPHKAEVRFSEERDLVQIVQHAVREALDSALLVPDIKRLRTPDQGQRDSVQTTLSWSTTLSTARDHVREAAPSRAPAQRVQAAAERVAPADWRSGYEAALGQQAASAANAVAPEHGSDQGASGQPERQLLALRPVGQVLGTYIVADDGEYLYIIDQHAAHERVLYERFSERLKTGEAGAIPLLTPVPVRLSAEQYAFLERHREPLAEMGLEFEAFGGSDVLVRAVPAIWEGLDYHMLIDDVFAALQDDRAAPDVRDSLREMIVTKACKAAVKANAYLSDMEIEALCRALSGLQDPYHCPHGRPVLIRMSTRDLEKEFRRIV